MACFLGFYVVEGSGTLNILCVSHNMTPTTTGVLFASPKQGGILQSSGFLDLKTLMALGRTAKSNAFDELSLIQLIEDELATQNPGVHTLEEAIAFWKNLYDVYPLWRQWLERNHESVTVVTRDMLSGAVIQRYDVMFAKMLRTVPASEHIQMVSQHESYDTTLLHCAARSGNLNSINTACINTILALYPESEHLQAVLTLDWHQKTVFHFAASSGNLQCINALLDLFPRSE